MIVRELLTRWGIDVDDRELERVSRKIKVVKKRFDEAGATAKRFGKNLTLFVTAPLTLAGGAFIKAASDAEETQAKFETVFSSLSRESADAAENLDKNFGLSSRAAKQLLADTGDLLTGFGFTQEQALGLSDQVQQLAVDLASFTNFSGGAEGASAALTKALLGETESAKSLGIVIRQDLIKAKITQLRAEGRITNESEQQAKAIAALTIATEQSKNAIGDFARTGGGFANTLRDVRGDVEDLAIEFGEVLLPIATDLLRNFIKPAINFLRGLSKETKTFILIIGGLVAALGPALIAFGFMSQGLVAVVGAAKILIPLITGLKLASLGLAAIWLGAFAAIFLVLEDILAFAQGRKSVLGFLLQQFGSFLDEIGKRFMDLPGIVKSALSAILLPIRAIINAVQALGGALGALVSGDIGLAGKAISEAFKRTVLPNLGDFGDLLGFGSDERARPTPSAQMGAMSAATAGGNAQVSVQNEISVPPGTPPELVGDAVIQGVKQSMDQTFRETREVVQPRVAF